MFFGDLLQGVPYRAAGGDWEAVIGGIAYDSRRVKPGDLFVAVRGFKTDGHEYIRQALESGAAAVVMERKVNLPARVPWAVVDDSRRALALFSARFFGNPAAQMGMIGVTGTNGKTTTTNLIVAVLEAAGQKTGLIGTIHNRIGAKILPVKHTTPESTDLQKLLADMVAGGTDTCVMEISSHALALHRVDGCEFDIAVLTNFTQDHLDFHRDMEDYLDAKLKLFTGLAAPGRKTGNKIAVINADDNRAARFVDAAGNGNQVCTYGIKAPADARAVDITVGVRGTGFTVEGKWGRCRLELKITGLFNVYNALAAFTTAAVLGIAPEVIKRALENTRGVPGRFEVMNEGQNFTVIVDYAHTPDGLKKVLKTARRITKGKLITVFGCGGDRDATKRPLMGEITGRYSDFIVVTSDNPRTEDPLKIIAQIKTGLEKEAPAAGWVIEPDRREAIRWAVKKARAGDTVVIAGKGHEDYQEIGSSRFAFDDRREAAAAIKEIACKKEF